VRNFIATPDKNRFGGYAPFVIWEEKARELNPMFFKVQLQETAKQPSKETGKKVKKAVQEVEETQQTALEV
jgi:hypothetical protein